MQFMIQLIPVIQTIYINSKLRQIYEEAFPLDERRDWNQLMGLTGNSNFCLNEIYFENRLIGFISVWNLGEFSFIEHFAILKDERGKGFGSLALTRIIAQNYTPFILEVEEPHNLINKKRISFYENMGFKVVQDDYYQPPYSAGKNKVKMLLMSYPEAINNLEFKKIKGLIYDLVYNYNTSFKT